MLSKTIDRPTTPLPRLSAPADYDQNTVGRVGRMAMIGALTGSVVLGLLVTVITLVLTSDVGQALGVGVAVALTGGPFFGGLTGFAMAVHAAESEAGLASQAATAEPLAPAAA